MIREQNRAKERITLIALNATKGSTLLDAYAAVYVHRGHAYCMAYCGVSKSSVSRVQRAQNAMLKAKEGV